MTALSFRKMLAALLLAAFPAFPAAVLPDPDCAPAGSLTFICGVQAAEDSVALPVTRWLLTGGLALGGPGALRAVDTVTGSVLALFPGGPLRPDRSHFPQCPGPPDATGFSASGLALRPNGPDSALLYVVHNGARESVEVFEIDSSPPLLRATWHRPTVNGCMSVRGHAPRSYASAATGVCLRNSLQPDFCLTT